MFIIKISIFQRIMIDIIVRAYDLGGYGDIAGALRVTDYLARTGNNAGILPMSPSAREKLEQLAPHYQHTLSENSPKCKLIVDVAGHYLDSRVSFTPPMPHLFIEDMDNPSNREHLVPIYIKTGLVQKEISPRVKSCGIPNNPLFYRPFNEDEIPSKKILDPLELILKQIERTTEIRNAKKEIARTASSLLKTTTKIGFAHFKPDTSLAAILRSQYFNLIKIASQNSNEKYLLACFIQPEKKAILNNLSFAEEYSTFNIISKDFIIINDASKPTIAILGPTPQLETSKMFLSSTIPPLVTGDLSLSDAMYFLLAKKGPGFFYDCPGWKQPTRNELSNILAVQNPKTSRCFNFDNEFDGILAEQKQIDDYREQMRHAINAEIQKRFGIEATKTKDQKIPYGAPFLFQDAAGLAIDKLLTDEKLKEQTEQKRTNMNSCEKINVQTETSTVNEKAVEMKKRIFNKIFDKFSQDKTPNVNYENIEFETSAYRKPNMQSKGLLTFEQSLERLKQAGFQRHARPQEAFDLMIDGLEGKLSDDLQIINTDMRSSCCEWLSLAFERNGEVLTCYLDPVGLVWKGGKYEQQNFNHSGGFIFNIGGIPYGQWISLDKFRPDFVQFLYRRPFDQLPVEMRKGINRAHVCLPIIGGDIYPVVRDGFGVDVYSYCVVASRGVRPAQKK